MPPAVQSAASLSTVACVARFETVTPIVVGSSQAARSPRTATYARASFFPASPSMTCKVRCTSPDVATIHRPLSTRSKLSPFSSFGSLRAPAISVVPLCSTRSPVTSRFAVPCLIARDDGGTAASVSGSKCFAPSDTRSLSQTTFSFLMVPSCVTRDGSKQSASATAFASAPPSLAVTLAAVAVALEDAATTGTAASTGCDREPGHPTRQRHKSAERMTHNRTPERGVCFIGPRSTTGTRRGRRRARSIRRRIAPTRVAVGRATRAARAAALEDERLRASHDGGDEDVTQGAHAHPNTLARSRTGGKENGRIGGPANNLPISPGSSDDPP